MQIASKQLVSDLLNMNKANTEKVVQLKKLDAAMLNHKAGPDRWSVLECLEHLNLYGDFYLPELERRILAQPKGSADETFKSGVIGEYFANLMRADAKPNKMRSPKDKVPEGKVLSPMVLDRFLKQQERLTALLMQAQDVDLTRTKVSISISKLIKLRLGDTFRFMIYHIDRHIKQAEKAAAAAI